MNPVSKYEDSKPQITEHLTALFTKANAHATLDDALADIPYKLLGKVPKYLPYSIWQLTEHIRIAQWDILEFSKNVNHISPKWPDEYWPKQAAPGKEMIWNDTVKQIMEDREAFIELLKNADDIYKPFENGNGQTLLREALLIADHNAYHTAEIIVLRRLLNCWRN